MRKHTEKPLIDDLFARKLGGASLRPGSDGFARLQARVRLSQPGERTVLWRNPVVQRYISMAACLVLVAGLGWWYSSSNTGSLSEKTQMADKQLAQPKLSNDAKETLASQTVKKTPTQSTRSETSLVNQPTPVLPVVGQNQRQVAQAGRVASNVKKNRRAQPSEMTGIVAEARTPASNELTKGRANPVEPTVASAPTPNLSTERVLIVTIAEPAALVAARQEAQPAAQDQPKLTMTDKLPKEAKVAGLWQQIKRVKQGEVFARRDNDADEGGLLSRAYNGLKQSLDKDKSPK